MALRWQIGLSSLTVVVLSVLVALGPLEGIPHITDEIAYTLQSRLLAAGMRVESGSRVRISILQLVGDAPSRTPGVSIVSTAVVASRAIAS